MDTGENVSLFWTETHMSRMRRKLFSVTLEDCRVDTFTCGGHGGSGKDTSNTGVRIVHEPSGAVGECREERSQLANKRRAFRRMAESAVFQAWARRQAAMMSGTPSIDQQVEDALQPQHVRIERRGSSGWEVWND